MSFRGFMYFLVAFSVVIVLGLTAGCSSSDYLARADVDHFPRSAQFCGFARCDGNRVN